MFTPTAEGASLYWTGAINGYWSEPGNWDPQAVPQNGDNVFFVRDNDAHRVMTNDLSNLSIDRINFGVFDADQGDNDYNYELNGNILSFVADGSLISSPDGSSTVTINCPLRFHDGGYIGVESESVNPLFQETARLVINGPLTVNAGILRLTASGSYSFANQDGRLILAGALSGGGDVRLEPYSFSSVEFIGPANNTLRGIMYLDPDEGGEIIFNKTAGYVVTNVLSVVNRGEATLKLNLPNQFGPDATISLTEEAILHLSGTSQLIGNLVLTNNLLPAGAPPILDTGNTTCHLRNGITSRVTKTGGAPPIIKGSLSLTAGDHNFKAEADGYAGLEIQAEISGAGGFTKTGGAALLLRGVNTFIGDATAAEGIVDVDTPGAFGGTAGGVNLNGGSVTLRNVSIQGEPLFALGGDGSGEFPGSVLTVIGAATWTGPMALSTNLNLIGGDIVISGPISGAGGLGCFSLGTITLGGTLANTYTGKTLVRCPLLQLNKPFGINAYAGPLEVGGGFGGPYEVRWFSSFMNPTTAASSLTLFANGIVTLNANVEDFGPVLFNGGLIQTTPGSLGGFFIAGFPITVNPAASPAVINGNLALSANPAGYLIVSNGVAEPDLLINATTSGANIRKQGAGTLTLTSANTHNGYTLIEDGILEAQHPQVFGTTTANTIVWSGATLRLGGIDGMAEGIQIEGAGFQGTNGAVQVATGGSGTMYGGFWLNGPATINTLAGSSLAVNADIGGNGPLTKTGSGTLTFSGSTANDYSGGTLVSAGTLQLFKNSNLIAAPGTLTIGPAAISSPATVRCFNTAMIPSGGTVTVNANSLLDLNGYNQTLAQLNLNDGGDAQTVTGSLGFPAGGNINIGTLNPGLPGLQNSSSISGRIALPPLDYLTFNVSSYGQQPLSFEPELAVSAVISGGGNIVKNGFGTMRLSGANTFNDSPPFAAGDLIINAGTVIAASNGALGGTAGWTWVQGGGRLSLINNITVNSETLYLNSTNPIVIDNPGGNNFWTGPVILARDSGISVNQDWSLFLYGAVSGSSANDLTKVGMGALVFGGVPANTYGGETFINAGELHLAKPFVVTAVPGALSIGNAAGAIATVRNYQSYQVIGNIFINRNGTLDVNGFEENVDHLYLADGGDVHTGTGYLYLKTAGSLTVTPGNNNNPSTMSGNVEIVSGTFPFNINAAPNSTSLPDLDVTARLSSGGAINLQKNGGGWLRLGGNNTYTGQTYLNAGTLQVDGQQPQSPVTLDHDTRLQGSGTVGHIILNGGSTTISPGASPGTLTSSNLVASGGSGTLQIELNGTTPGSGHDQVNVRGSVNLTGLKLSGSLGFNSSVGQQFTIINNDGADATTGTFTGLAQNGKLYLGGELFQINYSGGTGNDVVLSRLVTPPPPVLTIEKITPSLVRLRWPTNDPAFRLIAATNLTTTNWTQAQPLPVTSGTNLVVTNSIVGPQRFYRLINP